MLLSFFVIYIYICRYLLGYRADRSSVQIMAPALSKYVSQKNALIGGAVAGVPLLVYLLKKYSAQKKTAKRYQLESKTFTSHNVPNNVLIFIFIYFRRTPENDIKYLIVDVSCLDSTYLSIISKERYPYICCTCP